jgi:cytochrome P450
MTDTVSHGLAPGSLPVLGHIHRLARDPLAFLMSLTEHGDVVRVRLGTRAAIVVCDAALTRTVLLDDHTYDKGGPLYDRARDVIGNGLATCSHAEHRRQRRLTQPAFRHDRMPGYTDTMIEHCSDLIGSWRDGQVIDASEEIMRLTARVAVGTLFSDRVSQSMLDEMAQEVTVLVRGTYTRMLTPSGWEWLLPGNRRFLRSRARLRRGIGDLIAACRAEAVDHGDLMSMLLATDLEDGFSDVELIDQATTFFSAGAETAANVLSSALHLLAHHPEIQHRLSAEAHRVVSAGPLSYQRLEELPYTDRVLSETLRLYPPAWLITRRVTVDTELGGYAVSAGTSVLLSPYVLHRRADLFADPETFDPDRQIGALGSPHGGFVAFGAGARKCIGETFSRVEAVLLLASLAARWRILPITGSRYRVARSVTLAPRRLRLRVVVTPARGSHAPSTPRTVPPLPTSPTSPDVITSSSERSS